MLWHARAGWLGAFAIVTATCLAQMPAARAPKGPESTPPSANQKKKTPAPDAPAKPPAAPPEEVWLYPAQRVSADLESQSWRMRRDLHGIAMATLAAAWVKQDRMAAEHRMLPAVDDIAVAPQEESRADRARRIDAAHRLMALLAPFDSFLRERLKDIIATAVRNGEERTVAQRRWSADGMIRAAQHGDPHQLAAAISDSVANGSVTAVTVSGLQSLRANLPDEADLLFRQALTQAEGASDAQSLRAFSSLLSGTAAGAVPDDWKQAVAGAYSRVLGNSGIDQNVRCDLADEFAFRPQAVGGDFAQTLNTAAAQCIAGIPDPVLAADALALQRRDPQSSDDYMAAADEAKSPISRAELKFTAAEKAEKEEDHGPQRALEILDGMTREERAARSADYYRRRQDTAVKAAINAIAKSSCSAGVSIIEDSPRNTILHIAAGVAEKISDACYGRVMGVALQQMRRSPADDANDYVRLLNLVIRKGPNPLMNLQVILREMDNWKEKDPKTLAPGEVAYSAAWNTLLPLAITPQIFDVFSPELLSAIARGSFRNDLLRADFELLLVRGFLDRYAREAAKKKTEVAAD